MRERERYIQQEEHLLDSFFNRGWVRMIWQKKVTEYIQLFLNLLLRIISLHYNINPFQIGPHARFYQSNPLRCCTD